METPLMSLLSKMVSFGYLTSTLVSESLGKSRSNARSKTKSPRRSASLAAARAMPIGQR
jgi:hypothetical protein